MDSRVRALYKIEPQPGAPAQTRRIIAEELSSRLPHRMLEDVKLMVSELVTNGVVHADRGGEAPVMLDLSVNGDIHYRVSTTVLASRRAGSGPFPPGAVGGACAWSSSCPTAGGCILRHSAPKYGSSASARDVTSRHPPSGPAPGMVSDEIRQATDASSPISVISRRRASARRRIRDTCICETPISSAIWVCVMSWTNRSARTWRSRALS
jgi:hypothetical protein